MKLGVCTSPDKIMIAAEAGFEFIECGFAWLSSRSEEEYQEIVKIVDAAPIKVEACNGMLPAELKVTGPNVDKAALEAYLEKTFARAACYVKAGGTVLNEKLNELFHHVCANSFSTVQRGDQCGHHAGKFHDTSPLQ